MSEKTLTAREQNAENEQRAHALLYEAVQQALQFVSRGTRVTNITVRIPVNGEKLLSPVKAIEMQ